MKRILHPLTVALLAVAISGFCTGSANAQLVNVIRINSGGGAQNFGGEAWVADQYFTGGTVYSTAAAISNTTQDQIYQTERFGNVTYAIPVPSAGIYAVDFHLAEIYFNNTGQRVFNINVENGQFVRNNLDLIQTIGAINQAYVLRADNLNITDGTINITFTGVTDNAKISGISVSRYSDNNPVVSNPVPDHTAIVGDLFSYNVPANTFSDPNEDVLTYAASLSNGNPLPSWLSFNTTTRNFSGTPTTGDIGTVNVQVTASDGQGGSINDVFQLTVATGFYRAININGSALTIDGNSWEASAGAASFNFTQTNGGTFANQAVTLNPATDANRATMIRSSVYGTTVDVNVTSVPNGIYDVSIYVWEDNVSQIYSLSVEGTTAVTGYNSGSPGTWAKLGPFRRTVTDGVISVSTTGGHANISGIEISRGSTGEVLVNDVDVSPSAVTLAVGQATKLEKVITPTNATNLNVSWTSSNTSIATVDANGLVRGVGAGSATITATSVEGGRTGTSTVTIQSVGSNVLANPEFDLGMNHWIVEDWTGTPANTLQVVQGAGLSGANALHVNVNNNNNSSWMLQIRTDFSFRLEVGRTYRISFLAKAESNRGLDAALWGNGSNTNQSYHNFNLTTAVQKYSTTVTISNTAVNSESSFALKFYMAKGVISDVWLDNVRVEDITGINAVTNLTLSPTTLSLAIGQTSQLSTTFTPSNATNQEVTWTSSNTAIATVSNTGLVSAITPGDAVITAYSVNGGYISTSTVTVTGIPVAGVSVSPTTLNLQPSQTGQLTATILPANATNQNVLWSSSDTNVAAVSNTGLVTAVTTGSATITVTTADGGFTAQASITVAPTQGLIADAIEISALKDLYNSTTGANWVNKSNWPITEQEWSNIQTVAAIQFYGVTVANGDVVAVQLPNNNLIGSLPNSFSNLTQLQAVNFSNNVLTGNIQSWMVAEGRVVVFLQNNQLTGSLPEFPLNSTLTNLNLSNNGITGSVPGSIGNLSSIQNLALSNNALSGALPASIGSLTHPCANNQICGASIYLSNNKITSLPTEFWNAFEASLIELEHNEISDIGNVPAGLNFSGHIFLNGNYLSYKDLESAFSYVSNLATFTQQRALPVETNVTVGQPLELMFEQPAGAVTVKWEKLQSGNWQDITGENQSSNTNTFRKNVSTFEDAGTYRFTVTPEQNAFPYVTSGPVEIHILNTPEGTVLNDYAFQYKYDGRKRMTHKKVPGAEWVYMVYDNRDRLVMTQDGEQRKRKEWTFTKYDELNRPVLTGIYVDTETAPRNQEDMQTAVNAFYQAADAPNNTDDWFESRGSVVHGYTNQSFPKVDVASSYLTVTYYDDYSFKPSGFDYDGNQLPVSGNNPGQRAEEFGRVQGQVTGTKIKNLDTNEFLWSVNYYDDRYRVIQVVSQNNKGGMDKITNVYDFTGKVLRTKTDHTTTGPNAQALATTRTFKYDHVGRLLQTDHATGTNDPTSVTLAKNIYNELGQLVVKNLHSENNEPFKQQVDYRYNIRGWLTRINDSDLSTNDGGPKDYFGMDLSYENQYNGNIGAIMWSTNLGLGLENEELEIFEPKARGYIFGYDPMNRLTGAVHMVANITGSITGEYGESGIQYDLNGNILALNRTGKGGNDMDILDYDTYRGNQLLKVIDNGNDEEGFKDGNVTGDDYIYDANGNMITDKNKNIATIEYNHLNLPSKVTKDDGQYIKYIYNAAGVKLSQEVYNESDVIQKKTDYAGEFMYENDVLQFINHEEGRVVYKDGDFEYQYTLKDHLGNARITFTSQHDIETFPATMDAGNETEEEQNFNAYNSYTNESLDPTPAENAGDKILILNGSTLTGEYNGQVGLAKSFDVVPGDVISASVNAKFLEASGQGNLAGFAAALTQAFLLTPDPQPHEGISPFEALNAFGTIIANGERDEDDNGPQGFLNILVFDKEYNLVDAAFEQVGTAVTLTATVEVRQAGYVYVFLSNDGVSQQEIGFDNFSLTYEHSDVIQQDDYYPFGLTFNSYSRENTTPQDYKYNGKELQNELDLGWLDYGARMYDPAIARWMVVDPLAEKYLSLSPYNYVANIPTTLIDPNGKEIDWSQVTDRKERRAIKQALREHNSSSTYKNLYKELKKSDNRYVIKAEHDNETLTGGTFEANYTLKSEIEMESGGTSTIEFQNPATSKFFKADEKGGVLSVNLALTGNDRSLIADLMVEEVVHASQYENSVGKDKNATTASGLPGSANTEFEAKAIVGQIKKESKRDLYTTSADGIANTFGMRAFRTHSVSGYNEALTQWHTNPQLDQVYRMRPRTDAQPTLLMKLIK